MGGKADPGFDAMGAMNKEYGVCGFTAALYALYHHQPKMQAVLTNAAQQHNRMAAEIKSFLMELRANGDALTLHDIESFTGSFKGYEGFKIADYISKVNAIPKSHALPAAPDACDASQLPAVPSREKLDASGASAGSGAASSAPSGPPKEQLNLSIGMPSAALVKYLKYIGFDQVKMLDPLPSLSEKGERILGLSYPKNDPQQREGLAHYVYQKDGVIYNAGSQYASITEVAFEAAPDGSLIYYDQACLAIAVKG